jgi:RNA polymerase sigma-70 factor (ECF subfamily)
VTTDPTFPEFVKRIRAGDAQAASEFVKKYESLIRMEVRVQLTDSRLRRVFDSMDICQSVLGSFLLAAFSGQFDLDEPRQLVGLLIAMTRHKIANQVRLQRAQRRDHRRNEPIGEKAMERPGREPTPSAVVAGEELLEEFRKRLSEEERQLANLRAQGRQWEEIAAQLGGTSQGRRKQLERAVSRISQELGVENG